VKRLRRQFQILFGIALVLGYSSAGVADDWHYCLNPLIPKRFQYEPAQASGPETVIEADTMESADEWMTLSGNVTLKHDFGEISADNARYQTKLQELEVTGNVRIFTEQMLTIGDKANVTLGKDSGSIDNAKFWLSGSHIRGDSERIEFLNSGQSRLTNSSFTSCVNEKPAWELSTSTLEFNVEENEAVATHARLTFQGLPVFYFPYLSFPLAGRKTGLLVPEWGQTTTTGRYLSVPYYINIAPNRDATLTPRYFQERGTMLDAQYRYLQPKSRGQLDVTFLDDDKQTREKRYYGKYAVSNRPAAGWQADVTYSKVSDINYFKDFAPDYEGAAITHLEQTASAAYSNRNLRFTTLFQNFQTIDETINEYERPYQRYPNVKLKVLEKANVTSLRYSFDMDYSQFQRDKGLVGRRLDVAPSVSFPYIGSASYLKPKLTFRHTRYQLQNQYNDEDRPVRSINQFSIDSGLFLEKTFENLGQTYTQTLEPRLFYLYVPYKDQSQILIEQRFDEFNQPQVRETSFDSGLPEQSYAQLFRENRFTGLDRIGDSNQLTMALSSRILSSNGQERLRFSMGQIFYFKPPKIGLPGGSPPNPDSSDIIAEFISRWSSKWLMQGTFAWQPNEDRSESGLYRFSYHHDRDTIVGFNYRYQRGETEQAELSLMNRLSFNWKSIADVRYSLNERKSLEKYLGLEYQSCCWALRVMRRDYFIKSREVEGEVLLNKSIWIQFELKGLTEVGEKLDDVFLTGNLTE